MLQAISDFITSKHPNIKIRNIVALSEGLFAHTWAINNDIIAKVSKTATDNEYQNAEHSVLQHLYGKICVTTPELIAHGKLTTGQEIILEKRLNGTTFSYDTYSQLPNSDKQRFLSQYANVCRSLHTIQDSMPKRLHRTPTYQINFFNSIYTDPIRKQLHKSEQTIIEDSSKAFLRSSSDVKLLPCHADLHFNNIMVDDTNNKITGIIDLGAFHYADPAYEFRYLLGEPQQYLEDGYGKKFDTGFQDRQLFYCICMFLMGAANPAMSWVSSEQNIKRLQKLLQCRHMERSYLD